MGVMTRVRIITGAVISFTLVLLWWLYGHGFLGITIPGQPDDKNYAYTVFDKSGKEVLYKRGSEAKIKKLLPRGVYQVLTEASSGSEYRIVQIGGFLSSTEVTARLKPEKSREFVGNNPNFCMHYGQSLLYSYNCLEAGDFTVHLPASADTPTITKSENGATTYPIKGMVNVGGVPKVFLTYAEDDQARKSIALYDVNAQLQLTNPVELLGINYGDAQNILQSGSGFLVYNDTLSKVYAYMAPSALPRKLEFRPSSYEYSKAVELSSYGADLGALFNNTPDGADAGLGADGKTSGQSAGKSEFIVGGSLKRYRFSKSYTSGIICGQEKLCLISSGVLDVYSLRGEKYTREFSMTDVKRVFTIGGKAVVVTNKRVLALDLASARGSVHYNYGKGKGYCGSGSAVAGYVLCVVDGRGNTSALHINPDVSNQDSIDQKVFSLVEDPNVSAVSAYKQFIYVSPNLGKMTYSSTLGGYDYDPGVKQTTNRKIRELVKRLNIDTSRYTVINPYDTN